MEICKVSDNVEVWSYERCEFKVSDIYFKKENQFIECFDLFNYINNIKKLEQILKLSSVILIGA